ncbi:hypothetical protein RHMOL_Rhmol08G0181100 [Rhododendron molle]|uniref:Uncharacterized protein n=1 Tax=Rhododendron molle TaxID=49168 RepID=A0ACC0MPR4_RHOML|nr:hypothetical protein RHMOL_Rhmol08G0181100 [Rhododendron molle]
MGRIDEDGPCEFGEDAVDEDDDVVESAPFTARRLFALLRPILPLLATLLNEIWMAGKAAGETVDLDDVECLCGSREATAEEEADGANEGVAEVAGSVDLDRDGECVATEEV